MELLPAALGCWGSHWLLVASQVAPGCAELGFRPAAPAELSLPLTARSGAERAKPRYPGSKTQYT